MNLVSIALRRPITIVVAIIAVVLCGWVALQRMPRDIFPDVGVPVLYVAQPFGGMDPAQMEGFITNYYEYHFLYITGIEHVESKSIQGVALIKLQFHPGTNMGQAMAETVSYVNRSRSFMPNGTVPPFVMRFDAGSVPVGNLVFTSATRTLGELQDAALFKVRPLFATLQGVSAPPPFGASQRTIVIRGDPDRLRAYGMSPDELVSSVVAANTVTPSGNVYIGDKMPMVPTNAVVATTKDLLMLPLRAEATRTVLLRDVATVEDSSDIQTGYALVNGRRTVYIPVTKRADASTLSVVQLVKDSLAKFQAAVPDDVKVSYEFDQSPYVKRAISGLVFEGMLGAAMTGLMVLLFLRDWRSALIVVLNIPLALLASVTALWLSGQTINIMTLGGLALAVGILVDEATVSVENTHAHLAAGKRAPVAALDAANETAVPRLLAMLCILAIFIPSFFMVGSPRAMFTPLAMAVGFAMIASYLLSSTLVPILSIWLLRVGHQGRESTMTKSQSAYAKLTGKLVGLRWALVPVYLLGAAVVIYFVGSSLGTEIFPVVDAGQFQLRLRAPTGTRIDNTEKIALKTLDIIKQDVGPDNVEITLGFVGVQPATYPINSIHLWTSGPGEAVLQVQLKPGTGVAIEPLKEKLRQQLPEAMPDVKFSFEPGDIVSRVMSFGAQTPIVVDVSGPSLPNNRAFAQKIADAMKPIASLRDLQFAQAIDFPTVGVAVDRQRAAVLGIKTADVARSVAEATSSSRYTTPNFWADPKTGVGYQVQFQIPQDKMNSLEQIRNISLGNHEGSPMLLRNIAEVAPGTAIGEYDRYNMQRLSSLNANLSGEDLGHAAAKVKAAIASLGDPPAKVTVTMRGQVTALDQMIDGMESGLLVAILVVFLLLAINFQSLLLSTTVVSTIPAVIAGVALTLRLTGTTLNVQSLMGAIMAVGVAVANAILLVSFAERSRMGGATSIDAAIEGARSRLRPILMTSFAMIAGMMPMAIGFGEGGQQAAPLGRAVVGGLIAATIATLLILPAVFAIVMGRRPSLSPSLDPSDPQSRYHDASAARSI